MNILRSNYPLSSSQEMVYLDQLLQPTSPHFNVGFFVEVEGDFSFSLAKKTLNILSIKWPSLRTTLVKEGYHVNQIIKETVETPLIFKKFIVANIENMGSTPTGL